MKKTLILSICALLIVSCSINAKENNKKSLNSISESNNQYTITFKNDEGSILSTKQYDFGVKPSEPSTPSKENPVKGYIYTFSGWSPSVSLVTSDATYVATYKVETDKSSYVIKWVDGDGKTLLEENYNYGAIPNYHGNIPTKKSTSTTSYVFNGWEQDIKPVDASKTYTAKFDSIPLPSKKYSIDINCTNCSINKNNVIHEEYSPNTSVSYQFENISDDYYHYPFDLDVKVNGVTSNDYIYDNATGKLDIVLKGNTIINAVGDNSSIDVLIKFNLQNDTHKFIFTFEGNLDYVDWGDGSKDNLTSHTYLDEEKHTIKIYGDVTNFSFKENVSILYSNIYTSKIKQLSKSAFEGCTSLKSYSISKFVTRINNKAFMNCTSLTSISIPNSVTYIESEAFYGCTSLTSLEIPPSVKFIGFAIINGCYSLKSITIPFVGSYKTSPKTGEHEYYSNFSSILGDEDVSYITFYPNLKEVIITSPCKSISEWSFANCTYITSVKLPYGFITIPKNAFRDCSNLSTIYIPSGLKHIGQDAFSGCHSLLSFKFDELEEIEDWAFRNCTNISKLDFSSNLKRIGQGSFEGCISLKKVIVPNSVTKINFYAFKNCYSLSSVVIPNSLLTMSYASFYVDNRKIECIVDMSNVDHLVVSEYGYPFEDNDGTNLKIKVKSKFVERYTAPDGLFSNCKKCVIGV